MLDGEFDRPGERYVEFRRRLEQLGVHSEFHMIEGGPHPFWNRNPFFEASLGHLDEFFGRTLIEASASQDK